MSNRSRDSAIAYPPYGRMVAEWEDLIGGPETPPRAWDGTRDWNEWQAKVVELLSIVLWPRYSQEDEEWQGPARSFMHALTCADFALFRSLRPRIKDDAVLGSETMSHYALFVLEDEADVVDKASGLTIDRSLDASLRKYLTGQADKRRVDDIVSGYMTGLSVKSGNVDLEIKRFMQRPRAYQMAVLLGYDWFTHQHAKSAVTPSMISGHCIEALMGGVAAYYRAREIGAPLGALKALGQHTVDAGDRRVFAGVHYASDNISSWLVGLLLCPHVCSNTDGARWLWQAIATQSSVYREIKHALVGQPAMPHRLSCALLEHLGEHPGLTVEAALVWSSEHTRSSALMAAG